MREVDQFIEENNKANKYTLLKLAILIISVMFLLIYTQSKMYEIKQDDSYFERGRLQIIINHK